MTAAPSLRDRLASTAASRAPSNGTFVPDDVLASLGSFTRQDADACNFGVIRLDDTGKCLLFNKYQSEVTGVAPVTAEGRHWFTQTAPCTNNSLFYGNFKKGIAAGSLNMVMAYTFTYKMKPTNVKVHMYRDQTSNTNWVFMMKA